MKNKHLLITLLFIILCFPVVAQHEKEALSTPPIKWRGVGQFFDNEKVVKPKRDNFTLYIVFHDFPTYPHQKDWWNPGKILTINELNDIPDPIETLV